MQSSLKKWKYVCTFWAPPRVGLKGSSINFVTYNIFIIGPHSAEQVRCYAEALHRPGPLRLARAWGGRNGNLMYLQAWCGPRNSKIDRTENAGAKYAVSVHKTAWRGQIRKMSNITEGVGLAGIFWWEKEPVTRDVICEQALVQAWKRATLRVAPNTWCGGEMQAGTNDML